LEGVPKSVGKVNFHLVGVKGGWNPKPFFWPPLVGFFLGWIKVGREGDWGRFLQNPKFGGRGLLRGKNPQKLGILILLLPLFLTSIYSRRRLLSPLNFIYNLPQLTFF